MKTNAMRPHNNNTTTLLSLIVLLTALLGATTAPAQQPQPPTPWTLANGYFAYEGKPLFLSGANYIPSRDWYMDLAEKNWDPARIDADFAAMSAIGVRLLRYPPLWTLVQDDDGKIDTKALDRLDQLLTIAHRHGMTVQVEFFTGGVDGITLLPKWAVEGNMFTDPKILAREKELITAIANRVKNNPGLFGYDFGNETNLLHRRLERGMNIKVTRAQMRDWMAMITATAKAADPAHLITPGLSAERTHSGLFNIWDLADTTDYSAIHSYAYFDGTIKTDPWIGQRTLYDVNYGIAYSAMAGKPVLVQEIGFAEWWIGNEEDVAKALRITLVSAWAQEALGYLWWGSHNNPLDLRLPVEKNAEYSQPQLLTSNGLMNQLEYSEGLLDGDNHPKYYGLEFKRWADIISKLGVNWKELLPIVYILQPDNPKRGFADAVQRTAFTLAKQTHMNVKMWPEWKPIPPDAAAVAIAGFALTDKGKTHVAEFLNNGGTVLQTWTNDFAKNVTVSPDAAPLPAPTLQVAFPVEGVPMRNTLMKLFDGERLRVNAPSLKVKPITTITGPETRVILATLPEKSKSQSGKTKANPILTETQIGKGKYYYFAGNLEEALTAAYNPWADDDSDKIYSVLRPAGHLYIDSKYVELFIKQRGNENLLILLNRSDTYQHTVIHSRQAITLQNYETRAPLGAGKELGISLKPGEVLIVTMTENEK